MWTTGAGRRWGAASGASVEDQERALAIARRSLEERGGDVGGESLGAFLRSIPIHEAQRATLIARLQGTCAFDLDRVPLRVAERGTFEGGRGRYVRVDAGNQAVAEAMAARLPDVRLRHVVERVRVDADAVHVEGEGRTDRSRSPGRLPWSPCPLRWRRRCDSSRRSTGTFGGAGRAAHGGRLEARRRNPGGPAAPCAPGGRRPLLVLDRARRPRTAARGDRVRGLGAGAGHPGRRLRGSPALARPRAGLLPDVRLEGEPVLATWGDDPFARGCYSCFDEASWERRPLLAAPAHGRVAFAGEHTAGLSSGTMDGAVESGDRAAAWVGDLLGRNR